MAKRPTGLRIDDAAWPLLQAFVSYWGITDSDGAAGGGTLVCSDLANQPDFDGNQVVIISGPYAGQARDINGATTGGTVTVATAFGGQITTGTMFAILALRTVPAEVAALAADVGDASSSTLGSLYGILGDPGTDLATQIAALGAVALITETTGTFSFDETNAGEQTVFTLTITARSKIGGIWLDAVNCTRDLTIRVKHQIDGATFRTFQTSSWATTDDDGILIEGFTAYRNVQLTLQCDGLGAGVVSIPYSVV